MNPVVSHRAPFRRLSIHRVVEVRPVARGRPVDAADLAAGERARIARDLRNGPVQRLAALRAQVRGARGLIGDDTDVALGRDWIRELAVGLELAIHELRATVEGSAPPIRSGRDLGSALRTAGANSSTALEIDDVALSRHSEAVEFAVYYACLESMQNTARHAGHGASVKIRLADAPAGGIDFSVADDGIGFDAAAASTGSGLANIRERVAGAAGRVTVESSPGNGTVVSGWVPDGPDARAPRRPPADVAMSQEALRAWAISAADAERQRIVRDLHDGAQQRLVALRIGMALAAEQGSRTKAELDLLARFGSELEAAIDDLRELTRGYLARRLSSAGIAEALRAASSRWPMDVRIRTRRVHRYSDEAELAVYYSCLEAMRNARNFAGTDARLWVSLAEIGSRLVFIVRDDGNGFDASETGSGFDLPSVLDRAALAGGCATVRVTPGRGAAVRGWVPVVRSARS
jgi:signal transduction histidine kinase